jgi:MSHA biogenesis protein MshO
MMDAAKLKTIGLKHRRRMLGFTLTEAIVVIVITGVLAAMVAIFIQKPVQGFFDTARRAALVDAADTVSRRISRDLREALPNSIRVNGTALEFLHVRSAGRYREQIDPNPATPGDPLDFTSVDTSFDVLGQPVNIQSGDSVVVYNLGIPLSASAYDVSPLTTRRVAAAPFGASLSTVTITSAAPFPFASPARRFQVVDTPVTYYCSGTQMRRNSGYAITASQVVPVAGTGALIADKLTACSFAYAVGPSQRNALVTIALSLTDTGETVSLIYQVHVNNVP